MQEIFSLEKLAVAQLVKKFPKVHHRFHTSLDCDYEKWNLYVTEYKYEVKTFTVYKEQNGYC